MADETVTDGQIRWVQRYGGPTEQLLATELLAARAALAAGDALAAMVRSGRACPEHAAAVPREWCSACTVAGEAAAVLVAANAYRAARGAR